MPAKQESASAGFCFYIEIDLKMALYNAER
jgi:hypothetical protein